MEISLNNLQIFFEPARPQHSKRRQAGLRITESILEF
jgi:hypothetical protein